MLGETHIKQHIKSYKSRRCAVLYGTETHISISQTCLDLLELGYEVHVVVDATSSYSSFDRNISLQRLKDSGAHLATFQSIIFDLLKTFEHPLFK
jgi:nicotinamidase-related amidase